jgi:hypothetical protein
MLQGQGCLDDDAVYQGIEAMTAVNIWRADSVSIKLDMVNKLP